MNPLLLCKDLWVSSYHHPFVYEAPPSPGGVQAGVLFCTGHSDVPYVFPGIVQFLVDREHPSVQWGYCILMMNRDLHLLKQCHNSLNFKFKCNTIPYIVFMSKKFINIYSLISPIKYSGFCQNLKLSYMPYKIFWYSIIDLQDSI